MNRKKTDMRMRWLLGIVAVVALAFTGCARLGLGGGELPDDGPAPAISKEAAVRFIEKSLAASQSGLEAGAFTLTITDEEATSLLNIGAELADQLHSMQTIESLEQLQALQGTDGLEGLESAIDLERFQGLLGNGEGSSAISLPDLRLRISIAEPQVHFKANGHVVLRGYAELGGGDEPNRQPLRVVVAPRASEGELVLDFVEGQLGPVPVPELLFDLAGKGLAALLLAGQEYATITEITVGAGTFTLSGRHNLK
ncbi:MAG: hypothetical protein JXB35_08600 [Anaerolineae bacterium]|nr:hypothetical protein [Anaerolineae bacterium]